MKIGYLYYYTTLYTFVCDLDRDNPHTFLFMIISRYILSTDSTVYCTTFNGSATTIIIAVKYNLNSPVFGLDLGKSKIRCDHDSHNGC